MTKYIMDLKSYKEFFNSKTKIKKADFIMLHIKPLINENDCAWEYSIEWEEMETEERGKIRGINTSSIFALNSCSWEVDDE